jgi:hypothetical protein
MVVILGLGSCMYKSVIGNNLKFHFVRNERFKVHEVEQ